jgi:hypothetical protein
MQNLVINGLSFMAKARIFEISAMIIICLGSFAFALNIGSDEPSLISMTGGVLSGLTSGPLMFSKYLKVKNNP